MLDLDGAAAVCLEAGDRVLVALPGRDLNADRAAEIKDLLAERFPGVEFTITDATSVLAMRAD